MGFQLVEDGLAGVGDLRPHVLHGRLDAGAGRLGVGAGRGPAAADKRKDKRGQQGEKRGRVESSGHGQLR